MPYEVFDLKRNRSSYERKDINEEDEKDENTFCFAFFLQSFHCSFRTERSNTGSK